MLQKPFYRGTPELSTERLTLRRPLEADAADVFPIFSDEEVVRYLYAQRHETVSESERNISDAIKHMADDRYARWHIVPRNTNKVVGTIQLGGLNPHSRTAEVAYAICRDWWHLGIATEALKAVIDFAFDVLGFARLNADHANLNPASGRVLQKAGFKFEGVRRNGLYIKGEHYDAVTYGILHDDAREISGEAETDFFHDTPDIDTARLLLRRMTLADANDVFNYASDPEVARHMIWNAHSAISDTRAYITSARAAISRDEMADWGVELKATGRIIGAIGLVNHSRKDGWAEVGYVFNRDWWGQGIATEALKAVIAFGFDTMGLTRVTAQHFTENPASGRVMQKAGMAFEGIARSARYVKGAHRDLAQYAILHSDPR